MLNIQSNMVLSLLFSSSESINLCLSSSYPNLSPASAIIELVSSAFSCSANNKF